MPKTRRRWRGGFSLTEILIVIGLIVLMIALAVPTFNVITGNRSLAGAQNNISAFLGRARVEAIGLQETRGVMFLRDLRTGRVAMMLVRETDPPTSPQADLYLDMVPDSEIVPLPSGVGVQFVHDAGAGGSDRYIGLNTRNFTSAPTELDYGGVILFDSRGQIVSRTYAFKVTAGTRYTGMGRVLYNIANQTASPAGSHRDIVPVNSASPAAFKSQLGFVLFEIQPFLNIHGNEAMADPVTAAGGYPPAEQTEEEWLDENAVPILVNRYNGTLVRGE